MFVEDGAVRLNAGPIIEVERDCATPGDEVKFGGGMGQSQCDLAVATNHIYTGEDAQFLIRHGAPGAPPA